MSNWYEKWFGKEYLELYAHRDQEEAKKQVEFILSVIKLNTNAKILDVACGNGRHLIEFLKLGFPCTGSDLSKDLIEVARNRTNKIEFYVADMRHLPFDDDSFDLVVSMFTSFGYFETDKEHVDTLKEWRRVTRGHIFVDYLNKDFVVKNLEEKTASEINGKKVLQTRRIENGRIVKDIEIDGENFQESVRLYGEDELREMLDESGFGEVVFYKQEPSRLMFSGKA